MTRDRFGALVTLIGAVALLAAATTSDNHVVTWLAGLVLFSGVGMRLWKR